MKTGLQQLLYPLNIYAAAMQRDQGRISYLSYGWVDDELSQAVVPLDAQEAMAEKILALINKPAGSRILDVGCGTGELLLAMSARDYDLHGIDCNAEAVKLTRQTLLDGGTAAQITQADFAQYWQSMEGGSFDVIVLQNSFRYFPPALVFAAAMHLLAPAGRLIISEEFIVEQEAQRKPRELPVLDYTLAEAERNGLQLSRRMDLTAGVTGFMQDFCDRLQQQAGELIADQVVSEADWQRLLPFMQSDLSAMKEGRRTHQLLQYDMPVYDPDKVPLRPLIIPAEFKSSEDYAALFEACFDTPFCPKLWQWKYGEGRGASIAASKGNRVVAHYGGMIRAIEYFGVRESAVQIGDVMVLPQERGFFSRSGLFFRTAAAMLEEYAGYSAKHLLGFGFPNIKAMHVAQRLKLYQKTDDLVSLTLDSLTESDNGADEAVQSVKVGQWESINDHLLDQLWERMKESLLDSIVGVRDADYLRFRYQQRPGQTYHLLIVDEKGKTPGVVIYRGHGEQDMVMDVIAAANDVAAVLEAAMQYRKEQGREMFYWLTRGQLRRIKTENFLIADTAIQIPCNAWSRGPARDVLKEAWWLTAGDTDFL